MGLRGKKTQSVPRTTECGNPFSFRRPSTIIRNTNTNIEYPYVRHIVVFIQFLQFCPLINLLFITQSNGV
jgi:hypothetical protein